MLFAKNISTCSPIAMEDDKERVFHWQVDGHLGELHGLPVVVLGS